MPTMHLRALFAAGLLATAAAPSAEAVEPTLASQGPILQDDGSVLAGGSYYADVAAYYTSTGERCPSRPLRFANKPANLAAGDCTDSTTKIRSEYDPTGSVLNIPVVFHVMESSSGKGHISEALLKSQIDILNEDYSALPGTPGAPGTAAGIKFFLATKDPSGNATTGIRYVKNDDWYVKTPAENSDQNDQDDLLMKQQNAWDVKRYLNIYLVDLSQIGLLGYAFLAQDAAGVGIHDGVILNSGSVGRDAPNAAPYDQGRTATHEVGHYLGLLHTFDNAEVPPPQPGQPLPDPICSPAGYSTGDLLLDTVNHKGADGACQSQNQCNNGPSPKENYMNYTDDACMTKFTPEQVNRMRCSIMNYRPQLASATPQTGPTVAFTAVVGASRSVTFTDQSTSSVGLASRQWQFGDNATSSEANPVHAYSSDGTYSVKLTVTDTAGASNSLTKSVTIGTATTPDGGVDAPDASASRNNGDVSGGCGCAVGGMPARGTPLAGLLLGFCALVARRRRRSLA